jgi:hypothetical protein
VRRVWWFKCSFYLFLPSVTMLFHEKPTQRP